MSNTIFKRQYRYCNKIYKTEECRKPQPDPQARQLRYPESKQSTNEPSDSNAVGQLQHTIIPVKDIYGLQNTCKRSNQNNLKIIVDSNNKPYLQCSSSENNVSGINQDQIYVLQTPCECIRLSSYNHQNRRESY